MQDRLKLMEELRERLAQLEQEAAREEELKGFMQQSYDNLVSALAERGASFEDFVQFNQTEIKKIIARGDRGSVKAPKASRASKVKIPAGRYTNVPPQLDAVFEVKEKGPRPKLVREHAEQLGIEAFMQQCAMDA